MISHLALYLSSSSGGNDGAISAFDVRDDGNYIYVASTNCLSIFNVHDVTGFLPKHTIYYKQPKPISKLLIQKKDGNFFGTLRNNVVALWDPNNSIRPLINILQMNSISINDFKWHPNDSSILFTTFTSTNTGGALVWDVRQSTKPMQTIISQGRDCSKLDIYSSGSNDILATLMDNKHVCVSDLRMIISTPVDDSLVHSNTRAQVICAQDPIREVRDIQFYGSGTATTIGNNLKNSKTTEQDSSNILLSYEDGAMDLWKVDLSAGCSLLGTVSPRARTRSELSAVADRHEEVEEDVTVSIPCPASFGALQYREEATVSHTGRNHQNIRRQHVINLFSFHPASLSSPFTDESCEPNSVLLYSKSSAESLVGLMWAPNHTNLSEVLLHTMLDSGLLQTFSINRDRLTELIEAPSSIDRDMSTSTEPIWNRNCEGSSHAKILQVTPEYSLSQLKPSLAGVQSKRSSGVMSGSIPHVASSSTLRNAGGASNLDLTSLNESALDLSFRLPAFESRSDQNSTTFILEQFWREIRDDLLYLEDDVLDEDSPSSYAGLTIGVVDQDAGQLIFEYDFVGDFPTSGQDWSIIHGEQGTNKMKTLVVNVSFPDKYPNRDLQPIISVTVQNHKSNAAKDQVTEAIDPVAWPSMEEELATKSRIFVAKLLKSAVERDRESDESQDGESTADGYLVFLVDVLLTRLKGSHSGDTATGLGLGTDEGSSSGVNVDNNEGGVTDASESAYLTTDINELGDPLAQRVPCPRTSGAIFSAGGTLLCFGSAKLVLAGQKPIEASRQSNNLSPVRAALTVKKKTDALPRSYAAWLLNEDRGRFSQTPFSTGTSYTNLPGLSGSAKQIRSIRQQGTTHISASYDSGEVGLDWEEADPDGETTFDTLSPSKKIPVPELSPGLSKGTRKSLVPGPGLTSISVATGDLKPTGSKTANPAASFLFTTQSAFSSQVVEGASDNTRSIHQSPSKPPFTASLSPTPDAPQRSRLISLIKDMDHDSQINSARSSVTVSQSTSYQQLTQLSVAKSPLEGKDIAGDIARALSPILSVPTVIESLETIEANLDKQQEALREREAAAGAADGEMTAVLSATQVNLYSTDECLLRCLAGEYSLGPVPTDSEDDSGNIATLFEFQKSLWLERAESCRFNASIVDSYLRSSTPSQAVILKEIIQIWNLFGVVIDIYMVSKDHKGMATEPVGSDGKRISGLINSWRNSAMGRPLLNRLINHLKAKTMAVGFQLQKQVLVTVLCIFGQQQLDTMLNISGSDVSEDTKQMTGLDDGFSYQTLFEVYTELLARWHLPIQSTMVRKHLKSDGELTAEYCAHVQLFCRFCGDQITERNPSRSSSADNVDGTGIDKVIKHLDQGRSLWCGKCSAYGINCCLCQQSVHGAAFICSICGHGGHVGEIAAWFRNQIECPSGCGCRCAELLHATDFDQSFEAEDYSGEFQRNYAFD